MREFNYSQIRDRKWDSELLGLVAAIYKEAGKQEMYLKQRPVALIQRDEISLPRLRASGEILMFAGFSFSEAEEELDRLISASYNEANVY
jgi:hypothetical protein